MEYMESMAPFLSLSNSLQKASVLKCAAFANSTTKKRGVLPFALEEAAIGVLSDA